MFLGFGYLYKFVMLYVLFFCFFIFSEKSENNMKIKPVSQNFVIFFVVA